MKKFWRGVRGAMGILIVTLWLCLCWAFAYWVAPYGYDFFNFHPNSFWMSIINAEFGFFIFGMIMFTISRFVKPEKRQKMFWHSLQDAIDRVARGDFAVSVDTAAFFGSDKNKERQHEHPFHQLGESINDMASKLHEMESMRQEFVSNVSHEIQSPLTSIGGFAKALQNDELNPEERMHYLSIIETESQRLSKLSDNLLKLTSLESEHPPFEEQSYQLDKQLRNIVLSGEPQWVEKSIEMDISLDEVTIVADENLMSQVWMNLLYNAIKFTPTGGTIGVHLSQQEGVATVRISDTGIGMSDEERLHVFERFYKADTSRNRSLGGNGLGLAIVKKIIDMHDGEISVKSEMGEGTEMKVTLPVGS